MLSAVVLLVIVILVIPLFQLTVRVKNSGANAITSVIIKVNNSETKCILGSLKPNQSISCYPNNPGGEGLGIAFTDSKGIVHQAKELGPYLEGNPDHIDVEITDKNRVLWTSGSTNQLFEAPKVYESIVIP